MTHDDTPQPQNSRSSPRDDLSEYLQVFIDESTEELEALVESILKLETNPNDGAALHTAFRMLHSLKGSCGMMGFETVGAFAHQLEDRFEKYRSGKDTLDRDTATLVLKSIDYFRSFVERLRSGDSSEDDYAPLAREFAALDERKTSGGTPTPQATRPSTTAARATGGLRVHIRFKTGLQLADLKARLIVSKLASIGEIVECEPSIDDIQSFEDLPLFSLTLVTERPIDDVRKIANVDGVESIEVEDTTAEVAEAAEAVDPIPAPAAMPPDVADENNEETPSVNVALPEVQAAVPPMATSAARADAENSDAKLQTSETLRIDIDRLDRLMNLTGELVVANARFAQITDQLNPVFQRGSATIKSRDLAERLRQRFELMRRQLGAARSNDGWQQVFDGLDDDLSGLDEQSTLWEEGRRNYLEISDAVDQLTRVSKNLQSGVLSTRMIPVGPLFNRFKRVIRDLSVERGKRVQLTIAGEKTELDKRMIDALGDPLLHLVRNAIDHGLESPDRRAEAGKPETGSLVLEATHRGNNVLITIRDDGRGLDVARIGRRIVERGLAGEAQVREMSEQEVIDHIWAPGFSTAETVTEVSGRGVGMDIVRNAIAGLSGTIDVASTPGQGTAFTIRLPLTLAIMHSLIVRFGDVHFSIPIDDVREIVSVAPDDVYSLQRHQAIDLRGELIPLATMDAVFDWNRPASAVDAGRNETQAAESFLKNRHRNVVLLNARGKTLGLCVDALVGRADIVIKSLAENFRPVRGLSGASIMGDGSVCLMLDSTTLVELAVERATSARSKS